MVSLIRLLHIFTNIIDSCKFRGKLWTQIRLLLEQSDLGLRCLTKRLLMTKADHYELNVYLIVCYEEKKVIWGGHIGLKLYFYTRIQNILI